MFQVKTAFPLGVLRAVKAINDKYKELLTLSVIARYAGMSRSALASQFSREVGVTVQEYLREVRLAVAKHQLRRGIKIDAVARDVGWRSSASLYRQFRRRMGMTPKAFQRGELSAGTGADGRGRSQENGDE